MGEGDHDLPGGRGQPGPGAAAAARQLHVDRHASGHAEQRRHLARGGHRNQCHTVGLSGRDAARVVQPVQRDHYRRRRLRACGELPSHSRIRRSQACVLSRALRAPGQFPVVKILANQPYNFEITCGCTNCDPLAVCQDVQVRSFCSSLRHPGSRASLTCSVLHPQFPTAILYGGKPNAVYDYGESCALFVFSESIHSLALCRPRHGWIGLARSAARHHRNQWCRFR